MKTINYKAYGSKAARGLFILALALPLAFSACKKDNAGSSDTALSNEEATDLITTAISPESGGMVAQADYVVATSVSANLSAYCGITKDTSVTKEYASANRSYNFTHSWHRLLQCSSPAMFTFSFTGNDVYNGPRISAQDSTAGDYQLTGIETSSAQVTLNHTYKREGVQQSKISKKRTFTTSISISTANLVVDKASRIILSGTASYTLTGAASTGGSFTKTGTITFLGNGKATVTITGSSNFNIQW